MSTHLLVLLLASSGLTTQIQNEPFLSQSPASRSEIDGHLDSLPFVCWTQCLEFLMGSMQFGSLRLLSKRYQERHDVFLHHQLQLFLSRNITNIWSDQIPVLFVGIRMTSLHSMFRVSDILIDEHRNHRRGIVCGVNILSGFPFMSLHLCDRSGWDEIGLICIFDEFDDDRFRYFRSWSYHGDWTISPSINRLLRKNLLCRLLEGSTIEMYGRFGLPKQFRIKRHDQYFDYKTCKKGTVLFALFFVSATIFCACLLVFG